MFIFCKPFPRNSFKAVSSLFLLHDLCFFFVLGRVNIVSQEFAGVITLFSCLCQPYIGVNPKGKSLAFSGIAVVKSEILASLFDQKVKTFLIR